MFTYILEVTLCWSIFYFIFYALLRKVTFYRVNRWYLLSAILLGITIPLLRNIEIDLYQRDVAEYVPLVYVIKDAPSQIAVKVIEQTTDWSAIISTLLISLYLLGIGFFSIRFLKGLMTIKTLYLSGVRSKKSTYTLVETDQDHLPFSFLNNIFISSSLELKEDIQNIIKHEIAHVNSKHSLDVLLVEVINIIFWFHPMIYLYKTALRQTHEYLADAVVIENTPRKQYGQILLKQSLSGIQVALAHHFFHSHIKKRINMMYQKKSGQSAWLKYSLALPVLFILFIVFSGYQEKAYSSTDFSKEHYQLLASIASPHKPCFEQSEKLVNIIAEYNPSKHFAIALDGKLVNDSNIAFIKEPWECLFSIDAIKSPEEALIEYGVIAKHGVIELFSGKIDNSQPEDSSIDTHKISSKIQKGSISNFNSRAQSYNSINDNDLETISPNAQINSIDEQHSFVSTSYDERNNKNIPLKSIDNQLIQLPSISHLPLGVNHLSIEPSIDNLSPTLGISNYTYVDDETAIELLNQEATSSEVNNKNNKTELTDKDPLIVIDGIVQERGYDLNSLDPNEIESIYVLKGNSALDKYGEKGIDGVIEVITKNPKKHAATSIEGSAIVIKKNDQTNGIHVTGIAQEFIQSKNQDEVTTSIASQKPLIVLNGEVTSFTSTDDLNLHPDKIATVNVLNGKTLIKKYGPQAKDGVIEVFTKEFTQDAATAELSKMNPLIVLNGEVTSFTSSDDLNLHPDKIATVNVLKGESALDKYGTQAKDGVVEVFTKEFTQKKTTKNKYGPIGISNEGSKSTVQISTDDKRPLFVINDEILKLQPEEVLDLNPEDIASINVLKGDNALDQYGEDGKDGVVIIYTKKYIKKQKKNKLNYEDDNKKEEISFTPEDSNATIQPENGELDTLVVFDPETYEETWKVEDAVNEISISGRNSDENVITIEFESKIKGAVKLTLFNLSGQLIDKRIVDHLHTDTPSVHSFQMNNTVSEILIATAEQNGKVISTKIFISK